MLELHTLYYNLHTLHSHLHNNAIKQQKKKTNKHNQTAHLAAAKSCLVIHVYILKVNVEMYVMYVLSLHIHRCLRQGNH